MVQDNKWGRLFMGMITGIFTAIMVILTFMSFFEHCEADIYSFLQERYIEPHRAIVYVAMALMGVVLIAGGCHIVVKVLSKSKNKWNVVHKILMISCGLICAASLFWIFFNDATPKYDQETLFQEARLIAGYVEGEFNTYYYELMPRNKGLTLVMAFMLRLLGDSVVSFRILNVVGAVVLLVSVSMTTKKLWRDETVTIMTILLLSVYYPIVVYTCSLY